MEINEDGFLEELLALRRETWESSNPTTADQINGFFSSTPWPFDGLDSTPPTPIPNSTTLDCSSLTEFYSQVIHSTSTPLVPGHQIPASLGGPGLDGPGYPARDESDGGDVHVHGTCKPEPGTLSGSTSEIVIPSSFNIGVCSMERSNSGSMSINHHNHSSSNNNNNNNNTLVGVVNNNKSKVKKVEGQPSKNLMAERRRRKRLNDRLSMLRSVVPKISKMDRTSILGDTIDYMKELLERINSLQEEIDVGSNPLNVMSLFKDAKPSDVLVRNSPKFDVERRNLDTRVEICCAGKPGLLLSTVTTLETLGLEIQQCVISCFNDFSLQASCSEEMEQRSLINSEDIKQALFRNAGYGGRCL